MEPEHGGQEGGKEASSHCLHVPKAKRKIGSFTYPQTAPRCSMPRPAWRPAAPCVCAILCILVVRHPDFAPMHAIGSVFTFDECTHTFISALLNMHPDSTCAACAGGFKTPGTAAGTAEPGRPTYRAGRRCLELEPAASI